MDDSERNEERPRPQNEGVRIIGAEEAAAALEKGEAEGRRPDDAPRFGDVPPVPSGERPVHRFPLPDTVDPTVSRPSVAPRRPVGDIGEPAATDDAHAHAEALWAAAGNKPEATDASMLADAGDVAEPAESPDLSLPEEGLNVSSASSPDLPHWTEPPTGEVPRVLAGDEDSDTWAGVPSRGPRWRDSSDDWDEDFDVAELADEHVRVGALDENRTEHSDLYDFDEPAPSGPTPAVVPPPPEPAVAEPAAAAARTRTRSPRQPKERTRSAGEPPGSDEADVPVRVLTAVAFGIVALIAFSRGTGGVAVLATVVVLAAAFELFTVLRRDGYLPAIPIGLLATVSIMLGAYWKGERAIPLIVALALITTMLWYLFGVVSARPTINVMATMGAFLWVGLLGSFASLILVMAPHHHGEGILVAAVLATVAFDIGSFLAGRLVGRHPLMPEISPHKTWEGVVGGLTGSLVVCVFAAHIHPWTTKHALLLGLVVAVAAPLGDLCESMIKRDLGLKDMGTILPGHGGILDRFDSMLFVLPATYYLAQYLNIH